MIATLDEAPAMKRVRLGEAEFRALVEGKSLTLKPNRNGDGIEIVLSHIPWLATIRGIVEIIPQRPPDPPQAREFLKKAGGN
jgi:hypothetical protein